MENHDIGIYEQLKLLQDRLDKLEKKVEKYCFNSSSIPLFNRRKEIFKRRFKKRNEISDEEHQKNVDVLFSGLDEQAASSLAKILDRHDRFSSDYFCSTYAEMFVTDEEREALKEYERFERQIKSVDDYFQYLDFKLPINYFDTSVFPHYHGIDKLKTLYSIQNKTIFDVGCLYGESILIFRKYSDAPIISFEPNPSYYELAQKTLKLNNIESGVKIENMALGSTTGMTKIVGMKITPRAKNGISIPIDTLDNYVAKNNIDVGLIKVDVEGGEMHFLRGALQTIKEQKPILMLSVYHSYDDLYTIKPFLENLGCGYKFYFHQSIDKYIYGEILLFCEVY